ncbi:NAD-dependent dihydropyrimidine dehydrogenase subunit PreA [subsurface metagenome]
MADLSTNYAGLKLKNPLLAASATETKDAKTMKKCIDAGFGGVVVKSLYGTSIAVARKWHRPRFQLLNWHPKSTDPLKAPDGFILYSVEQGSQFNYNEWRDDVNRAKDVIGDKGVVIGSIMAGSMSDWPEMCEVVRKTNMDALEIDLSCPHMKETHKDSGVELGADPEHAAEITKLVIENVNVPVIAKLTPQTANLVLVAKRIEKAGAAAITCHNRMMALDINIETASPTVWPSYGGWGGPWMMPYNLAWLTKIYADVKIPISSTSGVWKWQDIIAATMAGATTVQSCTAILVKGFDVVKEWLDNMNIWMDKKGYKSLDEIRGAVMKNLISGTQLKRGQPGVHAVVDEGKCTGCLWCEKICLYEAITIKGTVAEVNEDKCDGCGMCSQVCPSKAISMSKPSK